MERFRNAQQFKAFMKKEAKRLNLSYQNAYLTFVARSLLEKLSKVDSERTILVKGSSAETTHLGNLVRGIVDVDLASLGPIDANIELFQELLNDEKINSLKLISRNKPKITSNGIYQLSFGATIDNIVQPLGIDFHDNYDRLIERNVKTMPKIFEGDEEFEIMVPSFEEYLAEKLCIILESNRATRLKDFYDIYELHGGKYDPEKLTEYFRRMLELRAKLKIQEARTDYLDKKFIESHQPIWNNIKEKYGFLDKEIDLEGAVYYTRAVLREELQKNNIDMPENPNLPKQFIRR